MLNDFEAVGYGVPELEPADLVVLHDVPAQPKARHRLLSICVLGPLHASCR